jgi:hypothetical protein
VPYPKGWLHRVYSDEPCWGYGGGVLKAYDAERAASVWLTERALAVALFYDFTDILTQVYIIIISL